jgi:hypothetical protein
VEVFVALGENKSSYKQAGAKINQREEAVLALGFPAETGRWPSWVHGISREQSFGKRSYHKPRDPGWPKKGPSFMEATPDNRTPF